MATEPTEAQIEAFGQKLQTFAATLTAEEQDILERILTLAMGPDDEDVIARYLQRQGGVVGTLVGGTGGGDE